MQNQYITPMGIEQHSMEIITQELGDRQFPPEQAPIIKRVIHTTADFSYADTLYFSKNAVQVALQALEQGAHIVTDTQMALAGINKSILHQLGGAVHCFMSDSVVASEAKERGVTRAVVSMEHACQLEMPLIFAIGNAPTALMRLRQLVEEGVARPVLIIGVPVGFVNVVEAKEQTINGTTPCIVARGRKGGSTVAAAICNALLYQIKQRL